MLCKTFKINSVDYTDHANENGLTIFRTPVSALPDEYTMDGTLHDDVIKKKSTYIIKLNPVPPAVGQAILATYDNAHVSLTVFDLLDGAERTVNCKTGTISSAPSFIEDGDYTYWQLSDLTFREL